MNKNVERIKERLKELASSFDKLRQEMSDLSNWNSLSEIISNIGKINEFITNVVLMVQITSEELEAKYGKMSSDEKLEAAVSFLDDQVKLPIWLEVIDGPAFKLLISLAVDWINEMLGKSWNLQEAKSNLENGVSFKKYIASKVK
ncbi:MAG: hypothetical protein ACOC1K_08150 [Nanoarchaeota archaeon]